MNLSTEPAKSRCSDCEQSLLVTVEEATSLLHIGRTTAYELVMRGLVPSVKIGRRRLVVREGLQKYVDELSNVHIGPPEFSSPQSTAPIA
jgi:excisionase family DNA binding protein